MAQADMWAYAWAVLLVPCWIVQEILDIGLDTRIQKVSLNRKYALWRLSRDDINAKDATVWPSPTDCHLQEVR